MDLVSDDQGACTGRIAGRKETKPASWRERLTGFVCDDTNGECTVVGCRSQGTRWREVLYAWISADGRLKIVRLSYTTKVT